MSVNYDLGLKDFKFNKKLSIWGNLEELKCALKRTWDRAWTGIDRYAYWSADSFYMHHMRATLTWLLKNRNGSPPVFCQDKTQCHNCDDECHKSWDEQLTYIIDLITQWINIDDDWSDIPFEELESKQVDLEDKIFNWLKKYWRDLWD